MIIWKCVKMIKDIGLELSYSLYIMDLFLMVLGACVSVLPRNLVQCARMNRMKQHVFKSISQLKLKLLPSMLVCHSLIHFVIHLLIHSFNHLFTHSLTRTINQSINHSIIHSRTPLLCQSINHSLTHPPPHQISVFLSICLFLCLFHRSSVLPLSFYIKLNTYTLVATYLQWITIGESNENGKVLRSFLCKFKRSVGLSGIPWSGHVV